MDATAAVESLRSLALASAEEHAPAIAAAHVSLRASATNLAHYLAVRRADQRSLQMELQALGVSSLGNMEMSVLPHLDAVLCALKAMAGAKPPPVARAKLSTLLHHHATASLGPAPQLGTRVMVTLPTEAATDASLADGYLRAGMTLARINCAHDSPAEWQRMAAHVRAAEARQGRRVLLFDNRTSNVALLGTMLRLQHEPAFREAWFSEPILAPGADAWLAAFLAKLAGHFSRALVATAG